MNRSSLGSLRKIETQIQYSPDFSPAVKEQPSAVFSKVPEGYIAFVDELPGANAFYDSTCAGHRHGKFGLRNMKAGYSFLRIMLIVLGIVVLGSTFSQAQERPTILAGHGTLSGSILPLWVGAEANLFEKHGLQVKPIYLPRAAGRPALLSGDIQVYFSAGPPWCKCA